MKIHLMSDLHLEFSKMSFKGYEVPEDTDVVVLAGDTHPGVFGLMWAAKTFKDLPIVVVAGNHEFYGKRRLHKHYMKMQKKAKDLGIHFLQNDSVVIDGVRFLGGTLWVDYNLYGNAPLAMLNAVDEMNDYKCIAQGPTSQRRLQTETVLNEHKQTVDFIVDELSKDFDGKTVVVTHHAPCELSCFGQYKRNANNVYYASKLEGLIYAYQPNYWLHGHVHASSDYMLEETRVVVNPRGYYDEDALNPDFDPGLLLEL